ncbi:MAG: LuxR family transcriptional regulator [Actinophytocola sp.]|nr:LuxR family transcriptional regulator [Actinophytocola sp.]
MPVEVSSFVGRRHELAKIRNLLAGHRLVTLLGVGGVGKTRLAIHAGRDLHRAFRDGVFLADLAGLTDATLLAQTVASSLGLRDDSPLPPEERLVELLAERQLLIVLDNCEHLVDDCARLLDTLLSACPEVRVLATSRTALQIDAECTLPVPPLSVPDAGDHRRPESLVSYEAVRLFTARATAGEPSFEITADNCTAVAELCRKLDGVPLAIELAAVRIRSLSAQQILEGLADRYRLLTQGSRAALPRQRTLRSLMDWSYGLLSEGARMLWARSSVFAHSFELDAAEGVCPDAELDRDDILDLLAELVDKSVLLREERAGRVRYRLLETVREYGLNRLRASGQLESVRQRHRDWYADLASEARAGLEDGTQVTWYHRLRSEHANLRAALDYCAATPAAARAGLKMAADLQHYWVMTGSFSEGRRWLRQLLAAEPDAPERVGGLTVSSKLAVLQADVAQGLGQLTEARTLAHSTGQEHWLADIAHTEGIASLFWGEPAGAVAHFAEALDGHKAAGNDFGFMLALIQSATARSLLGETGHALEQCEDCLAISRRHNDRWCAALAMWTQALLRWHWGDHARADTLAKETLRIKEEFGDRLGIAMAMEVIAWVAAKQGHHARAAQLLGAIESALSTVGATSLFRPLADDHAQCERETRAALGDEAWLEAFEKGASADFDAAVGMALRRSVRSPAPSPVPRQEGELTSREHEIAELVAKGLSNRDIAATLVISPRTAEKHVEKILSKLGLNSRTQIGVWVATGHTEPALPHHPGEPSPRGTSHALGA